MKIKLWIVLLSFCIASCDSVFKEYMPEAETKKLDHEDPELYYIESEISVYKESNMVYSSTSKTIYKSFKFEEHEVWEIHFVLDTLRKGDRLVIELFNKSYNHNMKVLITSRKGGTTLKQVVRRGSTTNHHLYVNGSLFWLR